MSTIAGLFFLVGGVTLFVLGILYLVAREHTGKRLTSTVGHFQRSREALTKIHKVQTTLRESSRARARAMHPAGQRSRRKSA